MFGKIIDEIGLGNFLVLMHLVPLVIATAVWSVRNIRKNGISIALDILGIVAIPVAIWVFAFVAEDKHPGGSAGTPAAWFLIFSGLSIGTLPLVTMLSCFWSGRLIGRGIKWGYCRRWYSSE